MLNRRLLTRDASSVIDMPDWQRWIATIAVLACLAYARQTCAQTPNNGPQSDLKTILGAKVKTEWEAFKKRDKKAYGDLLAEDFIGVEEDQQGTRTKMKAVSEVDAGNIYNYSLFGLSIVPIGPNAALATYELTMEFPPKAQARYLRVYVSELWLNRAGHWKIRHSQETRVK